MTKAIWLGGPKHLQVMDIPEGHDVLKYAERVPMVRPDYSFGPYGADFNTVSCLVHETRLAPGKGIRFINHPDIKEDTARMYLADLVIGAWDKHLADSRNRF